jgi:hypothetical protein
VKSVFAVPVLVLALLFTPGCKQDDVAGIIQDGAEAATVAAVITLNATLPGEAPLIISGLAAVDSAVLAILRTGGGDPALTLQELLDLAMVADPNLNRYRAIIEFCLPILLDIPGVQSALQTLVSKIPDNVRAYTIAFFTGIQRGLADVPGTTAEQVIARSPRLQKAMRKAQPTRFDPRALAEALRNN